MLKKVIAVLVAAVPFAMTGCNNGSNMQSSGSSAVNSSTGQSFSSANTLTTLAVNDIAPTSGDLNCLKAVLDQTQVANKLTTSITFNNTCSYDTFIGGYKIHFTSEYTDDTLAQLDALSSAYVNVNGKSRSYVLKFTPRQYLCSNGNGSFEILNGTLNARKVKAGTSLVLEGTTTLNSAKSYDLALAKSTFRVLGPDSTDQNELGISLSDPESFNYTLQSDNLNKGNDSLRNIPLNQFGLKTIMITNNRCSNLESAIPTLNLPNKVTVDRLRTTCKTDGTQTLLSEQSCKFVLRYDPSVNDVAQAYESLVNIDVYAKAVGNGLVDRSNIFKILYSTRGKISGVQTIYDKITVLDNQPNGLKNISIGGFGLKTYTITNASDQFMESATLSYAPSMSSLPSGLSYDLTRTTCKLDGSQSFAPGQSCLLAIKYTPKIQQVEESAMFQVFTYALNSQKAVAYASNKYLISYSTSVNNTPSALPTNAVSIGGFDIDAEVPGLSFNNSITNIPVGSFGLKAYLITNDTGQNMYNVNLDNINELNSLPTLKVDATRGTCKFNPASVNNNFNLKEGQSCWMVFKYSPTVSKASVNYNLTISGYDAAGNKILSDAMPVIGTAR